MGSSEVISMPAAGSQGFPGLVESQIYHKPNQGEGGRGLPGLFTDKRNQCFCRGKGAEL